MGRYSTKEVVYTYDKFSRMKEFYAAFGKDWKKKINIYTASSRLRELFDFRYEDKRKDPLIDDKIKRINDYMMYCAVENVSGMTLLDYETKVCPGKKKYH